MTSQSWFWPTVAVVVALPISLLILTEVHQWLLRRGSSYARPVLLLRNAVLPALGLLILVDQLNDADVEATWPRITATVFGFLLILFALSGANAALFGRARAGSWRERLPSIFIDLGRLLLIVIGLGLLFSWVWGTNIGGLFAAVGVTSIVIGLAVQTAVGPVIAGLFLLFEQPFRIGDWLDTGSVKGRVLEVNWRSIHIDTGNGIQIVPNAALAGSSFTNLSRVAGAAFYSSATLTFCGDDRPGTVVRTLKAVADALPQKLPGMDVRVTALGAAEYKVSVPVASPADEGAARNLLLHRVWYAARRAGLHLDEADGVLDDHQTEDLAVHSRRIAAALALDRATVDEMLVAGRRLIYSEGETVQAVGSVPDGIGFIAEGELALTVSNDNGEQLTVGHLDVGNYIGATALTRQPVLTGATALRDTTLIVIPRDTMAAVVQHNPQLARLLGDTIEHRRRAAEDWRTAATP
ncbi:MAG: mechanosensitive ion channel family protein [Mycobacterium sp.]